jgi:superfamily II DNA or RNA helicase
MSAAPPPVNFEPTADRADAVLIKPEADHWAYAEREPRAWQRRALPLALESLRAGKRGVIRAVMGAGKSVLQAELIAMLDLQPGQAILVTVPSQMLVKQLAGTISERLDYDVAMLDTTHKITGALPDIVVCCHDSLIKYVALLEAEAAQPAMFRATGPERRSVIWIADEAHKTETRGVLAAIEAIQPVARIAFTATPWRAGGEAITSFNELIFDYGPAQAFEDGVLVRPRIVHPLSSDDEDEDAINRYTIQVARSEGPYGLVNASSVDDANGLVARLVAAGVSAEAIHSKLRPASAAVGILARHRAAETRVLVHVNMLSEGVDLPYLRWMVLRRDVQSSVRFPQELGRVLRSSPGKTEAVFYDPRGLWGQLGLNPEIVLGEAVEQEEPPAAAASREGAGEGEERGPRDSGVRGLVVAMDDLGRMMLAMRRVADTYGHTIKRRSLSYYNGVETVPTYWAGSATPKALHYAMDLYRDLLGRRLVTCWEDRQTIKATLSAAKHALIQDKEVILSAAIVADMIDVAKLVQRDAIPWRDGV